MTWRTLPNELDDMAEALRSLPDTEIVGDDLRVLSGRFRASWLAERRVSTGNTPVRIPPPRSQGLHPRNSHAESCSLKFEFVVDNQDDAFPTRADFQVAISGALEVANGLVQLEDHWRVDTDLYANAQQHREPHPLFHFQRGGHAQDAFAAGLYFVPGDQLPACEELWRGLLQSTAPRLPMLPMCPILMIDFAISQHNGVIWRALRHRGDYSATVSNAQSRLWIPFFERLTTVDGRRRWLGSLLH